jgi:hypothetical protein
MCKDRTMMSHVYVLGVSMSVQRQDNGRSCICVNCPVFAQTSIHLTHIHDRSLFCLCTDIDALNTYT